MWSVDPCTILSVCTGRVVSPADVVIRVVTTGMSSAKFNFSQKMTVPIQHTGTDRRRQAVLHLQPLKTRALLACKQLLACTGTVNCKLAYNIPEAATTTKTYISRESRGHRALT